MTARQQRRHEERQARKQAYKAERQAQAAAPPSETERDRAEMDTASLNKLSSTSPRGQINRANAQHSTGPQTPEGKLASSRNSFKHGLYSKQLVLPGEDPTELDALRDDLRREHQPATPTEEILVNELAEHYWRLRRMRKYEARIMGSGSIEELHKGFAILPIVQRTMAAAERGFHKALTALQKLQKERAKSPKPATLAFDPEQPAGFVPQNQPPATKHEPIAAPHPGFVSQNDIELDPTAPIELRDLLYVDAA